MGLRSSSELRPPRSSAGGRVCLISVGGPTRSGSTTFAPAVARQLLFDGCHHEVHYGCIAGDDVELLCAMKFFRNACRKLHPNLGLVLRHSLDLLQPPRRLDIIRLDRAANPGACSSCQRCVAVLFTVVRASTGNASPVSSMNCSRPLCPNDAHQMRNA